MLSATVHVEPSVLKRRLWSTPFSPKYILQKDHKVRNKEENERQQYK